MAVLHLRDGEAAAIGSPGGRHKPTQALVVGREVRTWVWVRSTKNPTVLRLAPRNGGAGTEKRQNSSTIVIVKGVLVNPNFVNLITRAGGSPSGSGPAGSTA